MLCFLCPVLLSKFIYEALQSLLLFQLGLHLSRCGILWIHIISPSFQIVKGLRDCLDLKGIHKTEGMGTYHVIHDMKGAATVDPLADQISLHNELY